MLVVEGEERVGGAGVGVEGWLEVRVREEAAEEFEVLEVEEG